MITYEDLVRGYILQVGDIINNCHGIRGLEVRNDFEDEYFLSDPEHMNSYIYEVVGIEPAGEGDGDFPEFKSLEALTKEAIRIFEASPFKPGDKVRIKERVKEQDLYPFSFINEMANKKGSLYTIKSIELSVCQSADYNGDFHKYILQGSDWNWHSSMFEKVDDRYESLLKEHLLEEVPSKEAIQENIPIHIKVNSPTIKIVL